MGASYWYLRLWFADAKRNAFVIELMPGFERNKTGTERRGDDDFDDNGENRDAAIKDGADEPWNGERSPGNVSGSEDDADEEEGEDDGEVDVEEDDGEVDVEEDDEEGNAEERNQSMRLAQMLIAVGFMVFVGYPAFVNIKF